MSEKKRGSYLFPVEVHSFEFEIAKSDSGKEERKKLSHKLKNWHSEN